MTKKPKETEKELCSCGFPQSQPIHHEHDRNNSEISKLTQEVLNIMVRKLYKPQFIDERAFKEMKEVGINEAISLAIQKARKCDWCKEDIEGGRICSNCLWDNNQKIRQQEQDRILKEMDILLKIIREKGLSIDHDKHQTHSIRDCHICAHENCLRECLDVVDRYWQQLKKKLLEAKI